jgi:formylglycine-generating enzyme required for sulfatase activity
MRLAVVVVSMATACSGVAQQAAKPPEYRPGETKCAMVRDHRRPLLVEWSAQDRASLEAQLKKGLVVVRYEGCKMELLPNCRAPGSYGFFATTRKMERESIKNEDDLYAKLPIGALSLEGKLKSAGALTVDMLVVGTLESSHPGAGRADLDGDCTGASHVLTSFVVGAFDFYAGAEASAGFGASAPVAGVSAAGSSKRERMAKDGDPAACERAVLGLSPPEGCGALLRVETTPIVDGTFVASAHACPPGSKWDGQRCVAARPGEVITCPPGLVWTGANCVPNVDTTCPTGMHFEGGRGCVANDKPKPTGGAMIRVPAGRVVLGERAEKKTLEVASFEIDVMEVTNADYKICVDDGKCPPPVAYPPGKYAPKDYPNYCNWETKDGAAITPRAERLNHPVNCIDWDRAKAYCASVGKRLPTEAEWELAARGTDQRRFPWGAAPPSGHACMQSASTCPVGSFPAGKGPFGTQDMAGNVAEWTATEICTTYKSPFSGIVSTGCSVVVRGGSFGDKPAEVTTTQRPRYTATMSSTGFGVRCAR